MRRNVIKLCLYAVVFIGGIISQSCTGDENIPLTIEEKKAKIEELESRYSESGVKIVIPDYNALTEQNIAEMEKALSDLTKKE